MNSSALIEAAVARWISGGVTSLTHPVLVQIQAECFGALGIEADWFEAEPFSGLEAGGVMGWLRGPRWNPARIDPSHPGAADLARWAPHAAQITVTADGILRIGPIEAAATDPWLAIRHSVAARGRAAAFLGAAAGSLLFDPAAAAIYREGNDAEFVRSIWARLDAAKPAAEDKPASVPEHKVDEAASVPAAEEAA